jgi:hypothetical protein
VGAAGGGLPVQILDADGNGRLCVSEMREGLLRLRVSPAIVLTDEDFDHITEVNVRPGLGEVLFYGQCTLLPSTFPAQLKGALQTAVLTGHW